jgi:hypothetical protein
MCRRVVKLVNITTRRPRKLNCHCLTNLRCRAYIYDSIAHQCYHGGVSYRSYLCFVVAIATKVTLVRMVTFAATVTKASRGCTRNVLLCGHILFVLSKVFFNGF